MEEARVGAADSGLGTVGLNQGGHDEVSLVPSAPLDVGSLEGSLQTNQRLLGSQRNCAPLREGTYLNVNLLNEAESAGKVVVLRSAARVVRAGASAVLL